ncbi:8-hydroxygeraniol dehydrogenase-like [Musa acuminata AAA Group]|uniref:8-hydroxygeraniol dehydrogenase-like n=1 Tax=Musa acuminata AAA Group TaxID=214697 RepID=UPI0031D47CA8
MGEAATENGVRKATSPEEEHPRKAFGWAARDASGLFSPFAFSRRNNGDEDVTIKILYCGMCHSDLHVARNEWGRTAYPVVPGHEIVGMVTQVGGSVQKFKVGDRVGVGCMVNSCRSGSCHGCQQGLENHCPGLVFTYNSVNVDGTMTYGGYSDMIVVDQHFVIRFPENMPSDSGAPLLCAGITVYAPMKYHGLDQPGKHLGVVGLGGLGHVAVRFGKALGMKVTVISSSPGKEKEATERLGADDFLVSSDPGRMQAAMGTMDGIIDTVSAVHDVTPLMFLLKTRGKMIMAGAPEKPLQLDAFSLILGEKSIAGTCIGGVKETQEMIDFAAEHNITADIELVSMDRVNEAMERLSKGDVRYRFVIDIGNTLTAA